MRGMSQQMYAEVPVTPTLAQEIALPESLKAQIVCLLIGQLDDRLAPHEYALKREQKTTYIYAQPRESTE